MNANMCSVGTGTRVATAIAIVMLGVVGSSASAGLIYGNGSNKPVTQREAGGNVWVAASGSTSGDWSSPGNFNAEYKFEAYHYNMEPPFPRASGYAFHQTSFSVERMNFLMRASAGASAFPGYTQAKAYSRLDMWLQASDATPYWLLLEGSKGLLSITRENGTDAGILSKNDDGTWRNAFGTLAAGWYHIQFSLSDDALGASTTGTVSGQFGIPTPSSIVILALGSAMATPRRRN